MGLNDIVSVDITANTVVPSRVGFGTPLVLDYHTRFAERSRVYKTTLAMLADGFLVTDPAYKMAVKVLSQSPKVKQLRVGRCANAPTQVIVLAPVAQDNHDYTVTVDGTDFTITSGDNATVAEIVTALVAEIVSAGIAVTNTDGGTTVTLTGTLGVLFEVTTDHHDITREDTTQDPGIVADLAAIQLFNPDFYTIHPTLHGADTTTALAAQVETMANILVTESGDSAELAGTGIGATLKLAAYARTALMFTQRPHEFPGAAWAGKLLPKDPGSATWKFKTLAGVTPDSFTDTEVGNLELRNVNYYSTIGGKNITQQGMSSSGEFIDITQGVDWFSQRLKERIFGDLTAADKIPYTDTGAAVLESDVRAQIRDGINVGFLASSPDYTVTVPKVADEDPADRANRLFSGIEFSAPLAGAIHAVSITGTVSV